MAKRPSLTKTLAEAAFYYVEPGRARNNQVTTREEDEAEKQKEAGPKPYHVYQCTTPWAVRLLAAIQSAPFSF